MADVIAFNLDHASQELQYFGQEWFELSQAEIFSQQEYEDALVRGTSLAREEGIDAILQEQNLDALVAPTGSPAWPVDLVNGDHFLGASSGPCAVAGYPIVNVTAGFTFGMPVGISFMGTAFSEAKLIKLASGFEHATQARRKPTFQPTVPLPDGLNPFTGQATAPLTKHGLVERLDRTARRLRFRGLL
jgi:amidase